MGAQRATMATKQATQQLRGDDAPGALDVDALRAKTKDATARGAPAASRRSTRSSAGAIARIEEAFAPIEERLPAPAKETVQKVRVAGKELHAKVHVRVAGEVDGAEGAAQARVAERRRRLTTPRHAAHGSRRPGPRTGSSCVGAGSGELRRLGDDVAQRRRRGRSRVASRSPRGAASSPLGAPGCRAGARARASSTNLGLGVDERRAVSSATSATDTSTPEQTL